MDLEPLVDFLLEFIILAPKHEDNPSTTIYYSLYSSEGPFKYQHEQHEVLIQGENEANQ
jgi:hypothetical protein